MPPSFGSRNSIGDGGSEFVQLKPGVIAFSDHRKDELVVSTTGLIKFADSKCDGRSRSS